MTLGTYFPAQQLNIIMASPILHRLDHVVAIHEPLQFGRDEDLHVAAALHLLNRSGELAVEGGAQREAEVAELGHGSQPSPATHQEAGERRISDTVWTPEVLLEVALRAVIICAAEERCTLYFPQ